MGILSQKQEQEAPTEPQEKTATIYDISHGKSRYRKQYIAYDNIERANKPKNATAVTSVAGEKAQKVVSVVAQKIKGRRKEFIANLNYIAKITGKKRRQNINIINRINGTAFNVTSYKRYKNHRNCYVFTHLEKVVKIDESKVQNFAQLELLQTAEINRPQVLYKNNNTESIRYNVHAHESNFLQNSEEVQSDKNSTTQITELPKELTKPVKLKKRLPNERKKTTNAERKAIIYHFNQYKERQDLKYHYPLSKEDGDRLQSLSGRDFTLNAMNEILLDMSKRRDNRFCSKAQFMAYFGKCLKYEKRDSVKTGNDNFYIKANVTPARQEEISKEKQVQQYLTEVEQKAISHVCPENQLKARLANTLQPIRSYELLSNIKDFKVVDNGIRIHLRNHIELSGHDKNIILSQIQCIYATPDKKIEIVEYVVENSSQQINGHGGVEIKVTANIPTLQKDAWGEICCKLIETFGIHVYNNWFSRLKPVIDEQNKTIELKAPNLFIGQWIENTYGEIIEKIARGLNMEVRLC